MLQSVILAIDFIVVFGLILWSILSYQKRKEETQTNYYLKLQKSLMDEHYLVLKNQITMTRKLRHDLANHIQTMESLEQSGRTREYMRYESQLKELYSILKTDGLCPNYILDAMLLRKKKQCAKSQIDFRTSLLTVDGNGIEQTDLMMTFYELMEYGSKQAEKGKEKNFLLEGNQEKGYLFLRMTCPASDGDTKRKMKQEIRSRLAQSKVITKKYEGELYGELQCQKQVIFLTLKMKQTGEKDLTPERLTYDS